MWCGVMWGQGDWHERVYRLCRALETAYRAMAIVNFALFLWDGQYRSLLDRLLRMRLVYAHSKVVRQVLCRLLSLTLYLLPPLIIY
jgi:peroxin-2